MLSDVACIAVLSLAAQMVFFSAAQGRAVISADSVQYVAAAQALLYGNDVPHFEMRKPGFILWLWLMGTLTGSLGWTVIAANHLLLATLPLGAYGLGVLLHSRMLGWMAALVTVAKLETTVWGNRMMSEALYAVLLTFGLLAAGAAWKRAGERGMKQSARTGADGRGASAHRTGDTVLWLLAGTLLGLAWLTRGTAAAVIAVVGVGAVGGAVLTVFAGPRLSWGAVRNAVAFVVPLMVLALFEHALNHTTSGRFAASTGTRGAALLLRMTYHQGEALPDVPEGRRVRAWLPERAEDEAFVASDIDVWVTRHRAMHDDGLNEWEYDRLMGDVGGELVWRNPWAYATSAAAMMGHHLLRRGDGRGLSPVETGRRREAIAGRGENREGGYWWSLPEWSDERRADLVSRMQADAATKSPFGDARWWSAARYGFTRTPVREVMEVLRTPGGTLMIVGLLAGLALGTNRRVYGLLAAAVAAEAALVGAMVITTERFQFVWVAVDNAAACAGVVMVATAATGATRTLVLPRRKGTAAWSIMT